MKKLFFAIIFLTGCYEHIPNGVVAQMAAERFLDTLYRPDTVIDKIGLNYMTIKEYLDPSKQKQFQSDTSCYHLSANEWLTFTNKVNDILSKGRNSINGTISVEGYKVNGTEHVTAFLIDSSFRKVFATIPLNYLNYKCTPFQ